MSRIISRCRAVVTCPELEFYGKTGELNEMEETHGDRHWIFPALKVELPKNIEWEVGAGYGLTEYSDDLIIKNIFSIVF